MTASQRTANPNGCAEPTKKEDDGIDTNIEALEEYICDNICRYREEDLNQEELDYFCHYCELQKHTDGIKTEYDKINHFDNNVAKKTVSKLKQTSPVNTGKYKKGWKKTVVKENSTSLVIAIHDAKYSLVHLLEKGHQKRGGGRVAAIKHVEPAEQAAIAELEKEIMSRL